MLCDVQIELKVLCDMWNELKVLCDVWNELKVLCDMWNELKGCGMCRKYYLKVLINCEY